MTTRPHRVYLDSNVLLAYLANEDGRASVVASILEDATAKGMKLVTSVLSIAEVAYISTDRAGTNLLGSEEAIDQLWAPSSPINVVGVSAKVARNARTIIRKSKSLEMKVVKPPDAIHLASAIAADCDRLYTYERESTRLQWERLTELSVVEPFVGEPRLDY